MESHQFDITHDGCPTTDPCLYWLTWPEWLNLPENLSPFGYNEIPPDWFGLTNAGFCFGRIDTANRSRLLPSDDFAFCIARIDQNTLYLDAFGSLWSARGSLKRDGTGTSSRSVGIDEQLLGTWEGTIGGGGEGVGTQTPGQPVGSYGEVRRVRITDGCPANISSPTCLEFFWESSRSEYFSYKGTEEEGYCYWAPIDVPGFPEAYAYKFCFRLKTDGTLDYNGHGNLWGEAGTLQRIDP